MLFLMRSKCGKIREMWGFTVYLNRGWVSKKPQGLGGGEGGNGGYGGNGRDGGKCGSGVGIADREGRLMR